MDTQLFQAISMIAATITMGIAAGVYLLYAFAIMPGLARTDDRTFVGAYQQIDTAIVGPFLLVFFISPVAFGILTAALSTGSDDGLILGLVVAAVALHLAMVGITVAVHVPLNNGIKGEGDPDRIDDLAAVRDRFNERRWVLWNSVRALAATASFSLLAWALLEFGRVALEL